MSAAEAAHHALPFGAELGPEGVEFRLWAPSARTVELCLTDSGRVLPMSRRADGVHALASGEAAAGSRYRFRIDGRHEVPDPASRFQPDGVHGPSEVVDSRSFHWRIPDWRGRPWEEAVVYELHVGAFTASGTFAAAAERLGYLAELGVTAIEVMPVAAFAGTRGWGYDGVLPFAPHAAYGRPDELRAFVDAAHAAGIMVLLDVVYNHFGPEGNYLDLYAKPFFTDRHRTPWGKAINFDGGDNGFVRAFFVHNALYWLEEFRVDGLRLDAVHAIADDSSPDIVEEVAAAVRAGPGRLRRVHLVLENHDNEVRYLERGDPGSRASAARPRYAAQWNDDFHHAAHVLLVGETDGYYGDYAEEPARRLARCLAEGFAYQGEHSEYLDAPRGEPSSRLPAAAFIDFLQNHDQVGNRAFGDRLTALAGVPRLRALTSILLLAPQIPALFMGEEFGCERPFLFFCDFEGELADAVRQGRRREFARFASFAADGRAQTEIPDPNAVATFERSKLDWSALRRRPNAAWLDLHRRLLAIRHEQIVPCLASTVTESSEMLAARAFRVCWRRGDRSRLTLLANLGDDGVAATLATQRLGSLLHREPAAAEIGTLPPWSVAWYLDPNPEVPHSGEAL